MRSINRAGLSLIEHCEGCRLTAYRDRGGVLTIGYGHTHDVQEGDTCTQAQAEQWLGEDIAAAENAIEHLVTTKLSDNEYAALVSFAYNVGFGAFSHSTLRTRLNAGRYDQVPALMEAWVFVHGKVAPELKARRKAEIALWNTVKGE